METGRRHLTGCKETLPAGGCSDQVAFYPCSKPHLLLVSLPVVDHVHHPAPQVTRCCLRCPQLLSLVHLPRPRIWDDLRGGRREQTFHLRLCHRPSCRTHGNQLKSQQEDPTMSRSTLIRTQPEMQCCSLPFLYVPQNLSKYVQLIWNPPGFLLKKQHQPQSDEKLQNQPEIIKGKVDLMQFAALFLGILTHHQSPRDRNKSWLNPFFVRNSNLQKWRKPERKQITKIVQSKLLSHKL